MQDNLTDRQIGKLTGFPAIDKPWLKYYDKCPQDLNYPQTSLWQFLWDYNKENLDDIVLLYFGKKITYREFFENVARVARALSAMGIGTGDMVTIMSMHTPETIYLVYALNYIGAVANNVYPNLTDKEFTHIIDNTNSKVFFVLDLIIEKKPHIVQNLTIPVIVLPLDESMPLHVRLGYKVKKGREKAIKGSMRYCDFLQNGKESEVPRISPDASAAAIIVYTSGTTGEPKGVLLSSYCINALATQDFNGIMAFKRGEKCLMIAPPFIGFGITQLHIMMSAGMTSILQVDIEPKSVIDSLFKYKPYAFLTGPAFVSFFLEHKDGDLRNLKFFIGGGGIVSDEQIGEIKDKLSACGSGATYSNGYGMTEAASLLCASANELSRKGSVGIPFIDTNIRIVNAETGEDLRIGEVGELWFSTPNLMEGYLNNPEATAETIICDKNGIKWLRTGDLGTVDEDGYVYIKGRLKRIYPTRGKDNVVSKLYPQRIEKVLKELDYIKECGVIVREDAERMNVAIAFVLIDDPSTVKTPNDESRILKELYAHVEAEMPEFLIPKEIRFVDEMPMTGMGKIDYRVLESIR